MVTDYCGPIPFKQKLLVMRTIHNIFWLLNCNQHNDISQNCVRLSIFVALVFLARYWLCNSSGQSIHHVFCDSLRLGRCIVQFSSGCYYYYSSPLNLCTITFCLLFFRSFDTYWIEMICCILRLSIDIPCGSMLILPNELCISNEWMMHTKLYYLISHILTQITLITEL